MNSEGSFTGPVNFGNPSELNILDFAKKLIMLTKTKSIIAFSGLPSSDYQKKQPDISLASKMLGWEPLLEIGEGLFPTINNFDGITSV